MRDLGAIIFLLFIVGQGVAAVVASLKKRQAKAAEEQAAEMAIDKKRGGLVSSQTQPPNQVSIQASAQTRMPTETRPSPAQQLELRTQADVVRSTQAAGTQVPNTRVPNTQVPNTQVKVTSRREEFIARRRAQIEELRDLARARTERSAGSPTQPQSQPRTAPPAKAPPRQPAVRTPVAQPEAAGSAAEPETNAAEDFWATKPSKRRGGRGIGIHRAVRSRSRLRELVVLKEVLEPPLALRKDPFTSD